jgi:hypothetical protein
MNDASDRRDDERRRLAELRVRDRRARIMAAAGVTDPLVQLTGRARVVLDWLARGDEDVCAGVVELLNHARDVRPTS